MAEGHIVPWTDPGGEPCCCEPDDPCVSSLVAALGASINNFVRIDLSDQEYELLTTGATLNYEATITLSGTGPFGGAITSYFPDPIIVGTTISFANCRGAGANNVSGLGDINSNPLLVLVTSAGVVFSYGASYAFGIILQAAGQGIAGIDAPLSAPAMYLYGTVARVIRAPNFSLGFALSSSGAINVGSVLGRSIAADKTIVGGTDGTASVSITLGPP